MRKFFNTMIMIVMLMVTLFIMTGCTNMLDSEYQPNSIGDCIDKENKNYEDIYELKCIANQDSVLSTKGHEKLAKLVNLKKITFIGLPSGDGYTKIFEELSKLEKLTTVEICDSNNISIDKIGNIKNLKDLTINGTGFKIKDLQLINMDSRFSGLQSLTLKNIDLYDLPRLDNLKNLQSLCISDYKLSSLDEQAVIWEKLVSLDISDTSITEINENIVNRFDNLESLNISYSKITDLKFVLNIQKLREFKYYQHSINGVDVNCLKVHPNYRDEWLID